MLPLLALWAACGSWGESPAVLAPEEPESLTFVQRKPVGTTMLDAPGDAGELIARWPALAGLAEADQQAGVGTLNVVPAPCEPCAGKSFGLCAVSPPTGCEILAPLVDRALRLQVGGAPLEVLRAAVSYADHWVPHTPASPMWTGADVPAMLEIWVDPKSPLMDVVEVTLAQVAASPEYAQLKVVRQDLSTQATLAASRGVRSVPTYFVNGHRLRGAQSSGAILRLVRMEIADHTAHAARAEVTP